MMTRFFIAFLLLTLDAYAQELERRPLLGIAHDTYNQEVNDDYPRGVEIKFIIDRSSAQKAGLLVGDRIIQYNGVDIGGKEDFKAQMRKQKTGDVIRVKLIRNEKVMDLEMPLTPFPKESSDHFATIYDAVSVEENLIRSIVTKPNKEGKHPALFIIQGIGCGTLEDPFRMKNDLISLIDTLNTAGLVTMRMERTGVGDSKGEPCQNVDFIRDVRNFKVGLEKLRSYDFVDPDRIFILGISMGGIIAPIITAENPVKGIIVYGTGGRDWYSYELENTFRQAVLEGVPMEEMDQLMRKEQQRLHYFFTEKKTPEEIKQIDPEMGAQCEAYPLHYSYFQQVADQDFYSVWSNCKSHVLAVHGHSDYVSSGSEHALIAAMVNKKNPGKASYIEFEKADHWMKMAASEKESMSHSVKETNYNLYALFKNWIVEQL